MRSVNQIELQILNEAVIFTRYNSKIMRATSLIATAAVLAVTGLVGVQVVSIKRLESELALIRRQLGGASASTTDVAASPSPAGKASVDSPPSGVALAQRVAELERAVTRLTKASEYLMEHGQLPLGEEQLADLLSRLRDPNASDESKLRVLRLLRRSHALNDEAVNHALAWLQSVTDPRTKRELLRQLDGVTNAALKAPLLGLLAQETNVAVRKEAIENLRSFVNDPDVETRLWQLLKDPDATVRKEAEAALRHGPLSETRAAALGQRALDPQAPLDERLTAARALREANVNAPEVTKALVELAKTAQDPFERAKLFRALDGANDPALMLPLVNGLQDPNPVVREKAADALSGLAKTEPAIQQWLRYIAENDADPRVRREAFRALENRVN